MQTLHRLLGTWRRAVDRYVALTEFARAKFIAGGLPAERLSVKGNFVDPDPGPGDGAEGFALFVGRLSPEKGIDTLLAAWGQVRGRRLLIVGDGPLAPQVQAASLANPHVQWLGRLPRAETLDWLGRAACVIVPSLSYEMFGMVVIEAFARGTPVVAARRGALAELVEHERTGLHFTAGDPQALSRAAARLLADGAMQGRMRRAARAEYERRHTAADNYAQLLAIYRAARRQFEGAAPEANDAARLRPASPP